MQKSIIQYTLPTTLDPMTIVTYLPDNYDSSKEYPVLIFFAGMGEKNYGTTDINPNLLKVALPQLLENGSFNPNYIILVPSNRYGDWEIFESQTNSKIPSATSSPGRIPSDIVDYAKSKYKTQKVGITGLSAGGQAVNYILSRFPNTVITASPVSSWPEQMDKIPTATKIFAAQGELDASQPFKDTWDRAKLANPNTDIRYIIYPGAAHDNSVWDTFYSSKEWQDWMGNALQSTIIIPPVVVVPPVVVPPVVVPPIENNDPKIIVTRGMFTILTPGKDTIMEAFNGNPTSSWALPSGEIRYGYFAGWDTYIPPIVLLDLQGIYNISKFRFFSFLGGANIKISGGMTPFDTTTIFDANIGGWQNWTQVDTKVKLRYILIELGSKVESPAEIEIYGIKESSITLPTLTALKYPVNVNNVIGVNSLHGFERDAAYKGVVEDLYPPFNAVREYWNMEWINALEGKYKFNPAQSGELWADDHLLDMKKRGKLVVPCLHHTPSWFGLPDSDFKPVKPGADTFNPLSYELTSQLLFQLGARYGSKVVSENLLDIDSTIRWTNDPANIKKSGLNLLTHVEILNEPDRTWIGLEGWYHPYELAAMLSAAADGHEGKMGPKAGLKTADPNLKLVMGGLTNLSLDYAKAMISWWEYYRIDKKPPIDVFNFHYYANSVGFQSSDPSVVAVAPETDNMYGKMWPIKKYIGSLFPDKQVWITEFGYDSNTRSPQRAYPVGTMSQLEVQAIWNIRSYLELMASGIDAAFLFMMFDEGTEELWGASGVLEKFDNKLAKKPVWYYISLLNSKLKGFKFAGNKSTTTIKRYKFTKGTQIIYVVWLPTSKDAKTVDTFFNAKSVKITAFQDKSIIGVSSTYNKQNIPISERPVFVEEILTVPVNPSLLTLPAGPHTISLPAGVTITVDGVVKIGITQIKTV